MTTLNNYEPPTDAPTFFEVLQAARDAGLVGERDTVLTVILSMVRGGLIVMTGPSRGGKDEVVDAAENVFESDELVYRWPADDSETDAYYRRHEINQYPVQRFPDLARLEEHHEKILKAFGEGRDARRSRTDITNEMGDQNEQQILTCPKTVIAFIASDNENVDLNDFPELRNRALILSVDASEGQTDRVNQRKAQEHAGMTERNVDAIRRAEIQNYHSSIPVSEWTDRPGNEIVNPAAIEIYDQEPIPQLFPEARQDFDRLLEFMETVTLYNYANRLVTDDGTRRMYTTPVDIWQAMTIMGNKMVMSALNLRREDRAVLQLLDDRSASLQKSEIQQALRQEGFNITDRDVMRSLDSMRTKGYVRVHQGSPNTYSVSEFASVANHDVGLDYERIVDAAADIIYETAPADAGDTYVDEFCEGDGLITTHPFTGEAVDIRETDELQSMVDEGISSMEDVFAGSSTDDDESDTSSDNELQGTLM
jgi:Fe2+ or Zn2+ uptake regulation protein